METKEEVIKKAWGKNYEEFKDHIDSDGWARYPHFQKHEMIEDVRPIEFRSQGTDFRPKSLQGIENNNGWIKIESEEDLPNEDGLECYIIGKYHDALPLVAVFDSRHGDGKRFYNMNGDVWSKDVITHYQPIIKPKPPLY